MFLHMALPEQIFTTFIYRRDSSIHRFDVPFSTMLSVLSELWEK